MNEMPPNSFEGITPPTLPSSDSPETMATSDPTSDKPVVETEEKRGDVKIDSTFAGAELKKITPPELAPTLPDKPDSETLRSDQ